MEHQIEIEHKHLFKNMVNLEQYASSVLDYSSRYSTLMNYSYAPENLTGKPFKYPMYGDFPDTYMLRTYGKWWSKSPAAQKHYMPQDQEEILAEDYVVLRFEVAVVPQTIIIYETYNPGSVVRIWGRFTGDKWKVLWEEAPVIQQQTSRKFTVELCDFIGLINEIRLDLNQSLLSYYTALDAVLLSGKRPKTELQMNLLRKGFLNFPKKEKVIERFIYDEDKPSYFSSLPVGVNKVFRLGHEVIIKIFSYLDLKSLSRCAQVTTLWEELVKDTTIYRHLSLKKYWDKINNNVMLSLSQKCRVLRKLDLSWCGNTISEQVFLYFLETSCTHLTHLSLWHCQFVHEASIEMISNLEELIELRLRDCRETSWSSLINCKLHNLETLDLSSTRITTDILINVLQRNTKLKYLNIDLCEELVRIDPIINTVTTYNKELVSWSSWKTPTMSPDGLMTLAKCTKLEEIDVGWCCIPPTLVVGASVLETLCTNCTRLNRLILSGWRNMNNSSLMPIVQCCQELRQLDLLGIKYISADICEKLLSNLKYLELLDVSFCELITTEDILRWRHCYPNVAIQRSCEHTIPTQMWE